jgi:hypothetical protein
MRPVRGMPERNRSAALPTLVGGVASPLAGAEGNSDGNGGTQAPLTTVTSDS